MAQDYRMKDELYQVLEELIEIYHEHNPSTVEELKTAPSPLEFMRYVSTNRPFVIRGGARDWTAVKRWNREYLCEKLRDQEVKVTMTPYGNADSVISQDNTLLFVVPHEDTAPFPTVLDSIITHETSPATYTGPVTYAQSQNDNLPDEYSALTTDVPSSIDFARIAFDAEPDAVNFWCGNSHAVTALHKDPYENLYVQVVGVKEFVLMPPVEAVCVGERLVRCATYRPQSGDLGTAPAGRVDISTLKASNLIPILDDPPESIPFATWDPDPQPNSPFVCIPTPFSHLARPYRVTLEPGDMLYLPALWYHKVSQRCGPEGFCVAVNYWYDMSFEGGFWSSCNLVRRLGGMMLERGGGGVGL